MNRTAKSNRMIGLAVTSAMAAGLLTGCATQQAPRADLSASRAEAALAKGKAQTAVQHAEAAVLAEPQNAAYRAMLGSAYLDAGRFASAETTFNDAMKLGDNSARTALSLALALDGQAKYDQAAGLLHDWESQIAPADLGLAYALSGQPGQGIQVMANAIRGGENTAKMRQNLAYAYALAGRWKEARLMASQDVPANLVGARMEEWSAMAAPQAWQTRVASLIDQNFAKTAATRSAPLVREGWENTPVAKAETKAEPKAASTLEAIKREPVEEAKAAHDEVASIDMPQPGSTAPIRPVPVHTLTVHAGTFKTASLTPPAPDAHRLAPTPAAARAMRVTEVPTVKAETPHLAPRPAMAVPAKVASASATVPLPSTSENSAKTHSGWMIQVGAFDDEKEARQRLDTVQDKIKSVLGKADPFTEKVDHGKKTFYRARFAGLEKDQAEAACKHLKHSDIPCMLLKN